jgi:hypothetical protein
MSTGRQSGSQPLRISVCRIHRETNVIFRRSLRSAQIFPRVVEWPRQQLLSRWTGAGLAQQQIRSLYDQGPEGAYHGEAKHRRRRHTLCGHNFVIPDRFLRHCAPLLTLLLRSGSQIVNTCFPNGAAHDRQEHRRASALEILNTPTGSLRSTLTLLGSWR